MLNSIELYRRDSVKLHIPRKFTSVLVCLTLSFLSLSKVIWSICIWFMKVRLYILVTISMPIARKPTYIPDPSNNLSNLIYKDWKQNILAKQGKPGGNPAPDQNPRYQNQKGFLKSMAKRMQYNPDSSHANCTYLMQDDFIIQFSWIQTHKILLATNTIMACFK